MNHELVGQSGFAELVGQEEQSPSLSLQGVAGFLRRRGLVVLATFAVVLLAGVFILHRTRPTYEASARMIVEEAPNTVSQLDASNPLSQLLTVTPAPALQTQIELLQSADLRTRVAAKVGGLPNLSVDTVKDTAIVQVTADGPDPRNVAAAANALLETYIADRDALNGGLIEKAFQFADNGAQQAKRKLQKTEAEQQAFKSAHGIVDLAVNQDAQLRAVNDLGLQEQEARAKLAETQAQIAATQEKMHQVPATVSAVVSAAADPSVQTSEAKLEDLKAQYDSLLAIYPKGSRLGDDKMRPLAVQIARQQKLLARQRASVLKRNERANPEYALLQNSLVSLEIAQRDLAPQAQALAAALGGARARLAQFPAWEVQMAGLQRRLDEAHGDYQMFNEEREHLRLADKIQRPQAHVIQRAEAPTDPIRPKKRQGLAITAALGLFFGLGLALLLEWTDDRIHSAAEADRALRLPTLGQIPAMRKQSLLVSGGDAPPALTEAYRKLQLNLALSASGTPARTVLVTSPDAGEGKSTTIANLAATAALDGKTVLVVDADLRQPTQHRLLGSPAFPGLADLLRGTHRLEDVVHTTLIPGVRLIPAGAVPSNPAALLGTAALADFLDAVRGRADLVLIDAPPVLPVADALMLSTQVDGVLFLISYGQTKKAGARHALNLLEYARAPVLGAVVNKTDAPSYGYYTAPHRRALAAPMLEGQDKND